MLAYRHFVVMEYVLTARRDMHILSRFEGAKTIEAPVLAHYGEKDPGVSQDIPGTVEAMKKYGESYTYKIYPGAQYGFHTDTSAERYHPEAAKEAWARTLDFFQANLRRA